MTAPRAARVETPADVLRRASARVRELGEEAEPGPWLPRLVGCTGERGGVSADDGERYVFEDSFCSHGNRAWIAIFSPAVAEPLAEWLDEEVLRVRAGYFCADGALALARALLGVPAPEPDGEGTT